MLALATFNIISVPLSSGNIDDIQHRERATAVVSSNIWARGEREEKSGRKKPADKNSAERNLKT